MNDSSRRGKHTSEHDAEHETSFTENGIHSKKEEFHAHGQAFEKKILQELLEGSQNTVQHSLESYQSTVMASITEFGRTIESMSGGIEQITSSAQELRDSVEKQKEAVDSLAEGQDRIDANSKEGLEKIRGLSKKMEELSSLSNSLQEMLTDNNDIADQLSILSINGSIEAARAGSVAGAPFKVVAQEISNLSDKASDLISNQAESVKKILSIISESNEMSVDTVEGFKQTTETISDNGNSISSLKEEMDQIASGAEELSAVVNEFSQSIDEMKQAVKDIEQSASDFYSGLEREFSVNSFAVDLTKNLQRHTDKAESLEEAANLLTQYLSRAFNENEVLPSLVLARIFISLPYNQLNPADIRDMEARIPSDAPRYLTLVGTTGKEKEWNRRQESKNHRVIPLPETAEELETIPMLAEMFRRMDVDYRRIVDPSSFSDVQKMVEGYMLVEEAEGSPYLPAQEEFVKPYGVQSELGYGGFLPSGAVFTAFLFFTSPLQREDAEKLKVIAAAIQQSLLHFDVEENYWSS